jgi:hypothetical protein
MQKRFSSIKPEMLIAVIAVFISLSTLVVYIYQSSIMKDQQKMSVWPYLIFGPSWGEDYLQLSLSNKGIGPALVKQVEIYHGAKKLNGVQEIMNIVPDSLQAPFSYSSLWSGAVIMAGENMKLFETNESGAIQFLLKEINSGRLKMSICYESVYGDSWTSIGVDVKESECE